MSRFPPKPWLHFILIAFLIATQGLVLAHEAEHGLAAADDCFVCLHVAQYKAGAAMAGALALPVAAQQAPASPALATPQGDAPTLRRARGPPSLPTLG